MHPADTISHWQAQTKATLIASFPSLSPKTPHKRQRIYCDLSPNEQQQLVGYAQRLGLRPTTTLKALAFAYLKKQALLPAAVAQDLHALVLILRGMGNNLNQIARHTNTQQSSTEFDLAQAKAILSQSEEAITRFIHRFANGGH